MNALTPAHQGDRGDTRVVTLGGIATLTSASSVRALITRDDTIVVLAAAVTDAAACEVTIQLGSADDDWLPSRPEVGAWRVQVEVTFADGSVLTWPTARTGSIPLQVLPEINPAT